MRFVEVLELQPTWQRRDRGGETVIKSSSSPVFGKSCLPPVPNAHVPPVGALWDSLHKLAFLFTLLDIR